MRRGRPVRRRAVPALADRDRAAVRQVVRRLRRDGRSDVRPDVFCALASHAGDALFEAATCRSSRRSRARFATIRRLLRGLLRAARDGRPCDWGSSRPRWRCTATRPPTRPTRPTGQGAAAVRHGRPVLGIRALSSITDTTATSRACKRIGKASCIARTAETPIHRIDDHIRN